APQKRAWRAAGNNLDPSWRGIAKQGRDIMKFHDLHSCSGCGVHRRAFLADLGMGFTGLVLGAMLHRDGVARASAPSAWVPPDGKPHLKPRAKSVIWLFMNGGVSHLETFDPKPMLNKYAGKSIAETPFKDTQDPEKLKP